MAHPTLFDQLRDALIEADDDRLALGIDLGTTKSCIAAARFASGELTCECVEITEPGQPKGMIALPSVVAVRDGEPVFGYAGATASTAATSPSPRTRSACATPTLAPRRDSGPPPTSPATCCRT